MTKSNKVKITITPAHIKNAKRATNDECAMALAIKDAIPGAVVEVYLNRFYINDKMYTVDEVIYQFNLDEQAGEPLTPFAFSLILKG